MNFAKYRVQLSTEKKYSSKYEYKYEYEYSIPATGTQWILLVSNANANMQRSLQDAIDQSGVA